MLLAMTTMIGCSAPTAPTARVFDGVFGPVADLPELPYRVADQAGLISSVATVDPLSPVEEVNQVPGRVDAVYLEWLGGMCDRRVAVVFAGSADRSAFRIVTERDFGGCRLMGIPRNLMIEFTRPVDVSAMGFELVD